jgi:hypothetical protein
MDGPAAQRQVLDKVLRLREQAAGALDRHAVPVWLFLNDHLNRTPDIRSDYLFQFLFRSFYRLDNAGLSDDFKAAYFELLQKHRGGPLPALRDLCERLALHDTKKGKRSLQFSFATKLLATIDPQQPLYDSFVASLFGFRRPDHLKDPSKRLDRLLDFYYLLRETSRWLPDQAGFIEVKAAFANRHEGWGDVPPTKQVDLILWATGKAAKTPEAGRSSARG